MFLFGFALVAGPGVAFAQQTGTVSGTVTDEATGVGVAGAQVVLRDTPYGAVADDSGQFTIEGVPAGTYTVEASFIGYLTIESEVTVGAGAAAQATIALPADPEFGETIVIVGARTQRSVTNTPVAVDLIDSEAIEQSGQAETNQILATVAPSYNATHQTISDGSDHINPASLRGLGPGQVLVLVNGRRRHNTALMHVNGTFGRGTVGVDLNSIPAHAIKRIEVLRDGASAQYGSDAIAGVINIVLKDYKDLLDARVHTGITAFGDGFETKLAANYGLGLGKEGYVNITGEFLQRNNTDRSGDWTGTFYPGVTGFDETTDMLRANGRTREDVSMEIGQSQATAGMLVLNAAMPVGAGEVYANASGSYRVGQAAGFYRRPEQRDRSCDPLYANGFLPEIHVDSIDWALAGGYRQDIAGFDVDVSVSHGGNSFAYNVQNSVNASHCDDTDMDAVNLQTEADAGGPLFSQTSANADVVRPLYVAGINKLAIAAGAEVRIENYQLTAGEEYSYDCGPYAGEKACGIQVFPGFRPENEVNESRTSLGAYLGLESELSDALTLDVAGRFENFSDFGSTLNGKVAARWNLKENMGLRGAVSTGYRAPALHQVWFSTISTQFVDVVDSDTGETALVPRQVLTANNRSNFARKFGIPELDEETSLNISAGVVAKPHELFTLTLDLYRIAIDDRIVLTSRFADTDDEVAELLRQIRLENMEMGMDMDVLNDVSQVQFFTNAVDTITRGVDIVANLDIPGTVKGGNLSFTGTANFTRTDVQRVNIPQGVADTFAAGDLEAVRTIIFNREEENRLEDVLPRTKAGLTARYNRGPVSALARATYYGAVNYRPTNPELDEEFDPRVIFDVDLGYQLTGGFKVSLGAKNLLNTMPEEHELEANRFNNQFQYSRRVSQYGINGGFYYLRLQYLM
ncbi:MAG: TonB-dependent receptor [Haliangiales bacterium]